MIRGVRTSERAWLDKYARVYHSVQCSWGNTLHSYSSSQEILYIQTERERGEGRGGRRSSNRLPVLVKYPAIAYRRV